MHVKSSFKAEAKSRFLFGSSRLLIGLRVLRGVSGWFRLSGCRVFTYFREHWANFLGLCEGIVGSFP